MTHLDDHSQSSPKIRTSIADTLSKIISIAAGESVGKYSYLYYVVGLVVQMSRCLNSEIES